MLAYRPASIRSARALAALLVCSIMLPHAVARADEAAPTDLVKAKLLCDVQTYSPGSTFMLGVHLKMKPHWHTYWVNPGESGEPTKIKLSGPAGFKFGPVQWPLPKAIESFGAITYGYEDEVMLLVPVTVDKKGDFGTAQINADVIWLACNDTCIEGEAKLSLALPVTREAPIAGPRKEIFAAWQAKVPAGSDAAEKRFTVEQAKGSKGQPQPALTITWKEAPAKVEWFPISTRAVAVESPVVKHEGKTTRIEFKVNVFQPDRIPGDTVESLVVFEDAKGNRRGVMVPFKVVTSEE